MRRLLIASIALALAAPLFATDSNPSAQQRKLIEKLFVEMNFDATLHGASDAMYAQMEKQLLGPAEAEGSDPEGIAEAHEMFEAFRKRAAKIDFGGELREEFVRIYAKYFSEQELKDLVAFYDSPAGKKSIEVLPHLMEEAMQAGAQHLAPKIEQAMKDAMEEQEKKRPWRRTMSDIRSVGAALESYAIDHEEKFPSGDYSALEAVLAPNYLKSVPAKDMWDHAYAYVVSDDGKHYRIVSSGADGIFEWDSRRIDAAKNDEQPAIRYRDRLEDDLIYQDDAFWQLPVQAKPKGK
jgi:uncharacterized protein